MRVAVIGLGRISRRHVQAGLNLGLEIVGICDVDNEALAAVVQQSGIKSDQQFHDVGADARSCKARFSQNRDHGPDAL